jgi:hypothetical protein
LTPTVGTNHFENSYGTVPAIRALKGTDESIFLLCRQVSIATLAIRPHLEHVHFLLVGEFIEAPFGPAMSASDVVSRSALARRASLNLDLWLPGNHILDEFSHPDMSRHTSGYFTVRKRAS